MWILPKQLISAFAADTEALTSDSGAASQACEQSLMRRSKPAQSSFYLREWKAGNLTRLRSGAISSPFLGGLFEAKWTSSLEVIPASHSAALANEPEKTTLGTSGPGLQMELLPCNPDSASSRTSKGTSRWDSPASSAIWKSWVTRCRGEYSARLNAVRHISANESLSWPTAKARDWKDTTGCSLDAVNPDGTHRNRRDRLVGAIAAEMSGPAAPDNRSTHGSRPGLLNPDWVETLMGLPVGWTDCGCLGTELCPLPQNERSECF
jgi:hypothetical protein